MKRKSKPRRSLALVFYSLVDEPEAQVEKVRKDLIKKGLSESLEIETSIQVLPEPVLVRLYRNRTPRWCRDKLYDVVEAVYKEQQVLGKPLVLILDNPSVCVGVIEKLPDSLEEYTFDLVQKPDDR